MKRKVVLAVLLGVFAVAVMGSIAPTSDACNIVWGQICTSEN